MSPVSLPVPHTAASVHSQNAKTPRNAESPYSSTSWSSWLAHCSAYRPEETTSSPPFVEPVLLPVPVVTLVSASTLVWVVTLVSVSILVSVSTLASVLILAAPSTAEEPNAAHSHLESIVVRCSAVTACCHLPYPVSISG